MIGNGKVFISHTHEDNALCAPLLAALDAWGVDYWFDLDQLEAGQHISERVQQAIAERDIFIRIGSAASRISLWTALELAAFRGLQIEAERERRGKERQSVTLILDPSYKDGGPLAPGVSERTTAVIDATSMPRAKWLADLRVALGLTRRQPISRRAAIGLGAAAVVTAATATSAGLLVRSRIAPPPYPKPAVIAFDNPQTTDPRQLWYYVAGSAVAPAVGLAGDVVFINSDDGLVALHANDGSLLWRGANSFGSTTGAPIVAGTTVYATGGLGTLYALNAADGTELWHIQAGSGLSDPRFAVADGVVYLLADDDYLYAFNGATGAQLWKGPKLQLDVLGLPGIAVGDGLVCAGSQDGNLYAVNTADGTHKWAFLTGGAVACTPTIANGIVYFGSKDTFVYAANATDASLVWRYQAAELALEVNNAPVIDQGVAYIGLGVNMTALDAASGTLLWQAPAATTDEIGLTFDTIDGQASVASGQVFACAGPYLYAFSTNNPTAFSWRFKTRPNDNNSATPLVGNGVVFFGADSHTAYALRTS